MSAWTLVFKSYVNTSFMQDHSHIFGSTQRQSKGEGELSLSTLFRFLAQSAEPVRDGEEKLQCCREHQKIFQLTSENSYHILTFSIE